MRTLTEIMRRIAERITEFILGLFKGVLWTGAFTASALTAGATEARRGPEATQELADDTDAEAARVLAMAQAFSRRARYSEARCDPEAGRPRSHVPVEFDEGEEPTPENLPTCR